MSVVHTTTIRNGLADYVVDQIDTGGSNGVLQFQTSGDAEVATLAFAATAFGGATGGTATAAGITADSDAAGGTIAKARIYKTADGITPTTEILSCSVTATGGGGDIELNSLVVSAGQEVSMTSLTYSAPA
jgi:hypothetical protein